MHTRKLATKRNKQTLKGKKILIQHSWQTPATIFKLYYYFILHIRHKQSDLSHDTDFPYVIRIIDDLRVIRPYHILIRICFKYTENLYTTHTNDNRRFKIHLPTTATEKHTLLADPGVTWWNLYCPTDGGSLFWKRPMKASLSNVTGLPNSHRGCAEGSPEGLITSIE